MDWTIQLCELNYGKEETEAVNRVLISEWLTMGMECEEFEKEFTHYIGHSQQGVFVSSATAALHLILMGHGVGPRDEVIVPALTFVSDANVIAQLGAKPVFADSTSLLNFNVSIEDILAKITHRTKAIVVVHFAGFPQDLTKLKQVCDTKGILLVEDCAHAPGASLNGRFCGTMGHCSFFSFFSNKNLAVGEGGMIFAENKVLADRLRLMRSHGMSAATLNRHLGRSSTYDVLHVGLNYRPDEIRGALGRAQLKKLSEGNEIRRKLFARYSYLLRGTQISVAFGEKTYDGISSYHIMPVILPATASRESVMTAMRASKIQTSIHYPSFKDFKAYKDYAKHCDTPTSDQICARELTLPLHPRMSLQDVDQVVSELLEAVQ